MIKQRIIMVLKIGKPSDEMIDDPDLSGPTIIGLCFGLLLLLSGKVHFGDIYAIFIVGNFFIYLLFNFMSQVKNMFSIGLNHPPLQRDEHHGIFLIAHASFRSFGNIRLFKRNFRNITEFSHCLVVVSCSQ